MSDPAPFALIDNLDAEPARAGRRARRGEALLAALLVLAVIGFAGGQWWEAQAQAGHYQAGRRAAATFDWAGAAAEYAAAGTYRDAAQQAARAQATRDERDRLYAQAQAAADRADWAAVLDALPRLREIGPDYRDTPHLAAVAGAVALGMALSGTVALRAGPDPPGLYSYLGGGWRRLPGSDIHSRVRAVCPGGDIVYDGLLDGAARGANGSMIGRHILRAARDGTAAVTLALNALRFDRYECTHAGVWGLRYENTLPGPDSAGWTYQAGFQATGSSQVQVPALLDPTLAVIDVTPGGEALVLNTALDFAGEASQVQLFVAAADGSRVRLLALRPGQLGGTVVSPDGRYVLTTVNRVSDDGQAVMQTALLFDLRGSGPAQPLITVPTERGPAPGRYGLQGTFVPAGPRAGQILLTWAEPGGARQILRLIDPAQPAVSLLTAYTGHRYSKLRLLGVDPAGDGLILANNPNIRPPDGAGGVLVYLDGTSRVRETRVPLAPGAGFLGAWVRAGRLIYCTAGTDGQNPRLNLAVAGLPLAQLGAPGVPPTGLYRDTVAQEGRAATLPFHPGPGLLAYVTEDGQIHTRTYTTGADVPLDATAAGFSPVDTRSEVVP
jgi:hypothetical protein